MKSIESYKITWNVKSDEGVILLQTEEGVEQLLADSAAEAMLLLDILRNESPVFYNDGLLFTGFEPVGEGENEGGNKKGKDKKKKKKVLKISY